MPALTDLTVVELIVMRCPLKVSGAAAPMRSRDRTLVGNVT
jgi:hypothetical protein